MTDILKSSDYIAAFKALAKRTLKAGLTVQEVETLTGVVIAKIKETSK